MSPHRTLIVNADDFGFTPDVNEGIIEAFRNGIVRATTLMANGAAFDDAVRRARENPGLDVGCHLVLVQGRSVVSAGTELPDTVAALLRWLALRRIAVYEELAAQVRRILDAGIRPTHLDTHKHTHLLPPVLDAVARISEQFAIPWVRRPFDLPLHGGADRIPWTTRATSRALQPLRRRFHDVLERHGCRTTEYFAGFQITGRLRTRELVQLMTHLPPGTTELMCHPGRCSSDLRQAHTRLKESREAELEALTAPETQAAAEAAGIVIASYREL